MSNLVKVFRHTRQLLGTPPTSMIVAVAIVVLHLRPCYDFQHCLITSAAGMSRFVDVESPYRPLYSDLDTNAVILEADHDIDVAKVKGKKRLACTSCRQAKVGFH